VSTGAGPRRRPVDRVAVDARAALLGRRSIKAEAKHTGLRLALSMVDLTTLEGRDSPERVRALCRKALRPHPARPELPPVAAVCVYPTLVETACRALAGSPVRVASVATAFPSGQAPLAVRLAETRAAVAAGADEIDMVLNRGAFLAGELGRVADEIRAVREACGPAHLKVILETGELETYDNVRLASDLAIAAGADFVKTSTGKMAPAATPGVVLVLLESVREHYLATGRRVGVKAAGGIRTARQALHYLVLVRETLGEGWLTPELFRLGASSLVDDLVRQILKQESGAYAARYDVPL